MKTPINTDSFRSAFIMKIRGHFAGSPLASDRFPDRAAPADGGLPEAVRRKQDAPLTPRARADARRHRTAHIGSKTRHRFQSGFG